MIFSPRAACVPSIWSRGIAAAASLLLITFLFACGDVGTPGPGPDPTNIAPESFALPRQMQSGSSQDFSGSGKSDILWRNTDGRLAIWLMNGMAQTAGEVIATVSTDWTIAGSGDFDGDSKADILWRNTDGRLAIWLMNGMAQKSSAVLATVGMEWTVAGVGDFDSDGKSDILWRNSNGQVAVWLMNGMAQTAGEVIATVSTDWTIAGSGDFDGDSKADILWRNTDGRLAIWLMNGMAQKSSAVIATVSTDWTIAGTGDFDGDGGSDILWRNTNGQAATWLMNGMAQKSSAVVAMVSTDWTIARTGDFDGDGKSDILWRNNNGQVAIWLMNGMAQKSGGIIATVGTDWTIAKGLTPGSGDFPVSKCGNTTTPSVSNTPTSNTPKAPSAEWRVTSSPWGIAVDCGGNVYVAETFNNVIEEYSSTGTYITRWGSAGRGNSQFQWPKYLAVDGSNNVYVADNMNHRIQKFSASGNYVTQWGSYGSPGNSNWGAAGNSLFNGPTGIAVDSTAVYVVDSNNNRVQKFDLSGTYIAQWGSTGTGRGQFRFVGPSQGPEGGIAVDGEGYVYVVDNMNHRIQKFSSTGSYITQWGSVGSGNGQFLYPSGIAVDSTGAVYVVDNSTNGNQAGNVSRVEKFDSSGNFITQWNLTSLAACGGGVSSGTAVATDSAGAIYVTQGGCVAKYVP